MKRRITRFLTLGIGFCFALSLLSVGVIFVAYGTAIPPVDVPPIEDPIKPEPIVEEFDPGPQDPFIVELDLLFHRHDGGA